MSFCGSSCVSDCVLVITALKGKAKIISKPLHVEAARSPIVELFRATCMTHKKQIAFQLMSFCVGLQVEHMVGQLVGRLLDVVHDGNRADGLRVRVDGPMIAEVRPAEAMGPPADPRRQPDPHPKTQQDLFTPNTELQALFHLLQRTSELRLGPLAPLSHIPRIKFFPSFEPS